ncbi:Slc35a3 [Symbiodinium sp. KB8]|nr:Slc35a3 [Symbiodinium sp. KB8]
MLVAQTVSVVFAMRLSRTRATEGPRYLNTTAVFFSEVLKLLCSFVFLSHEQGNVTSAARTVAKTFTRSGIELLKVSVPSLLYTVQNNLLFISLSNLSGAVYQVTYQLKILTTAVLSVIVLGKASSGYLERARDKLLRNQLHSSLIITSRHFLSYVGECVLATAAGYVRNIDYVNEWVTFILEDVLRTTLPPPALASRRQMPAGLKAASLAHLDGGLGLVKGAKKLRQSSWWTNTKTWVATSAFFHNDHVFDRYWHYCFLLLDNYEEAEFLAYLKAERFKQKEGLWTASWRAATLEPGYRSYALDSVEAFFGLLDDYVPEEKSLPLRELMRHYEHAGKVFEHESIWSEVCVEPSKLLSPTLLGEISGQLSKRLEYKGGKQSLGLEKWCALFILFAGVALIQLPRGETKASSPSGGNAAVGLAAVLSACATSGLAGVYLEKILKQTDSSIWMRNIQLAFFGGILAYIGCYMQDGNQIRRDGFLQGYSSLVWAVIALQAVGGLVVAAVLKYADNILKCFGNAMSIVISCLMSAALLQEFEPDLLFVLGTLLVLVATTLYSLGVPAELKRLIIRERAKVEDGAKV